MEQRERQQWEAGKQKASAPDLGPGLGHARVIIDLPRILARRDRIVFCARGIVSLLFFPNGIVPAAERLAHTLSW